MAMMFAKTLKERMDSVRLWRGKKWSVTLAVIGCVIVILALFAEMVFAVKEERVYIFPVLAESSGWQTPEHAFKQDLSSTAELLDFNTENSSYIGTPRTEAVSSGTSVPDSKIGRAHVLTPVTISSRMPPSA